MLEARVSGGKYIYRYQDDMNGSQLFYRRILSNGNPKRGRKKGFGGVYIRALDNFLNNKRYYAEKLVAQGRLLSV